jgi:hypothetical protein
MQPLFVGVLIEFFYEGEISAYLHGSSKNIFC